MAQFMVEVSTRGIEYYVVEAKDRDDAWANWFMLPGGEDPVNSEVRDSELEDVYEVED